MQVEYNIPSGGLDSLEVVTTAGPGQPPNVWTLLPEVLGMMALSSVRQRLALDVAFLEGRVLHAQGDASRG